MQDYEYPEKIIIYHSTGQQLPTLAGMGYADDNSETGGLKTMEPVLSLFAVRDIAFLLPGQHYILDRKSVV